MTIQSHLNSGIVWLTFYRAMQQTADMQVVEDLIKALQNKGLKVFAFFAYTSII